jgi:hypothetical protein
MGLISDPKRLLPLLLGSIAGVVVLVSLVQPNPIADGLLQIAQIITALGLFFGLLHVLSVHLRTVAARRRGWLQSIVLIIAAVAVFSLELFSGIATGGTAGQVTAFAADVFRYVYQPLATSILALLTFFALRASWRALQARPVEALLILGMAVIFLVAGGPWATVVPGLQASLDWIRLYPALGVARGLLLGVGIGALVASIRLLLGFDQPYLDR